MALDFTRTDAPVTSPRDLARRLIAGVRFLMAEQVPPGSEHFGAWPSAMIRGADARSDWNAFTTAMTASAVASVADDSALSEAVMHMQKSAAAFLHTCAASEPGGSYRFWPQKSHARPGPDLDDTALAHLALRAIDTIEGLDDLECMRLFGPYRLTSGCRPHQASEWACGFPGVFGTWMNTAEPIVDVCANANVARLLQRCEARRVPGYRAAISMLAIFVKLRTLPTDVAPYYRSSSMLAWLCAQLDSPNEESWPEEAALATALRRRLDEAVEPGMLFEDLLLLQSARVRQGLPPSAPALGRLFELQCSDGGWPPMTMCWNFAGTLRWTSRSFPSALAIELLVHVLRGNATC